MISGIGVAITLLTMLASISIITLCVLIIRIKKGRESAVKEDPYYASIHDLVSNIGLIGVNTDRNQAYGVCAVRDHEEASKPEGQEGTAGGEEHLSAGDEKINQDIADQTDNMLTLAVQDEEEHTSTHPVDLDEDGYVDVNA